MFFNQHNYIEKAVSAAGGPTKVSNLLGVSNGAVHKWIKAERVSNIEKARELAKLSNVPLEKLRPI